MGRKDQSVTRFIKVKPAIENQTLNEEVVEPESTKIDETDHSESQKVDTTIKEIEIKAENDIEIVEIDRISREFELTDTSRQEINNKSEEVKDKVIIKTEKSPEGSIQPRGRHIRLKPIKKLQKVVKKKKEKKSKKKKKQKEKKENDDNEKEPTKDETEQVVETAKIAWENASSEETKEKKSRKLPSCFGFISTWIAKRKEKRREKKRKAIKSRESTPTLAQHEHKKARGGEAFIIELDDTPRMLKPVLPPIQRAAGPIRLGTDARLQTAEAKRNETLAKRKEHIRDYERRKEDCLARKRGADIRFKMNTQISIQAKQAEAARNRARSHMPNTPRPNASLSSFSWSSSESIEGDELAFTDERFDIS